MKWLACTDAVSAPRHNGRQPVVLPESFCLSRLAWESARDAPRSRMSDLPTTHVDGPESLALLASKLRPRPLRPDLVARPRLLASLEPGLAARLVLVSAPAGFGKTTLVASWLADAGVTAAWLSLDQADDDPSAFVRYLVAAVERAAPGLARTSAHTLRAAGSALRLPRRTAQRPRRVRSGIRPRPRRLPPDREPGRTRARRRPPRPPAAERPPGDRHSRRPAAPARPATVARRPLRGPRRGPPLLRR